MLTLSHGVMKMQNLDEKTTITATEFKTNLGKYLDSAVDGQEIVITKNGRNAVRLVPYTSYNQDSALCEEALEYQVNKKVSYEEFLEIYENSDARMEYINGEIILLGSPNVNHQVISGTLYLIFSSYLKGKKCKVFYAPFDVHLYKASFKVPDVVQPDLLIACDIEEKVDAKGRYTGIPSLVVEILSPSTRTKDMVDKLNTYMQSGVHEFWVVDAESMTVLVYGFKDNKVDSFKTYKHGEKIKSFIFDGLDANVDDVFDIT